MHWIRHTLFCAALAGMTALPAQTVTNGSVGSIDANSNVAFSLTFDRVPDFATVDAAGRQATSFQFYIGPGTTPPDLRTRGYLSLVRGEEIHVQGDIPIRNDLPPDPAAISGGWGPVRGRVAYALNGRTLTFTVPAALLNVSGPFSYTLIVLSYGATTSSYSGLSGETIQFTAPASLAGKVYRDSATTSSFAIRLGPFLVRTESTIVFENEDRFVFLVDRLGTAALTGTPQTHLLAPRRDGRYRFARTGNRTASIDLEYDDGTKGSLALSFTSASEGVGAERVFSFTDLEAWNTSAARNLSLRGTVSPGRPLIVGFVVPGDREVVIRAVGPSLRSFGITNGWADPDFQLYQGNQIHATGQGHHADWDATGFEAAAVGLRKVFSYLGAFALEARAKDAADVVRLRAGAYTVMCATPAGDSGGEVLVEVYFLP